MKIYKLRPIGNKQFGNGNHKFSFHETLAPYLVYEIPPIPKDVARREDMVFTYGRACIYYYDHSQFRFRRKYFTASLIDEVVDYNCFTEIDPDSKEWQKFYEKFIIDKTKYYLIKA